MTLHCKFLLNLLLVAVFIEKVVIACNNDEEEEYFLQENGQLNDTIYIDEATDELYDGCCE